MANAQHTVNQIPYVSSGPTISLVGMSNSYEEIEHIFISEYNHFIRRQISYYIESLCKATKALQVFLKLYKNVMLSRKWQY